MSEPAPEDTRFVTLEDLKYFLRKEATVDDANLNEVLDAAIGHVDEKVYVALSTGTAQFRARPRGGFLILPVTHLEEPVTVSAPDGSVVAAASLDLDLEAGLIGLPSTTAAAGTYTVTATPAGGSDGARAALSQAVKVIAQQLNGARRGSPSGPRGGATADQAEAGNFSIPNRAAELMGPYLNTAGFA